MVKLTLAKISSSEFGRTLDLLVKEKIPVKTGIHIKYLIEQFSAEIEKLRVKQTEMLVQLCQKKEDGTLNLTERQEYQLDGTNVDLYQRAMVGWMNEEVEFEPVKVDDLGDISLTVEQLIQLGPMIES